MLRENLIYPTESFHQCGRIKARLWYIWYWDFGQRYDVLHCYRCGRWWKPRTRPKLVKNSENFVTG